MGRRQIVTAKGPRDGLGTTRVVMSRKLHLRQLRVFYSEAGVGAPTIMVHGLAGSSRWWFPLFPELTSANLRVLASRLTCRASVARQAPPWTSQELPAPSSMSLTTLDLASSSSADTRWAALSPLRSPPTSADVCAGWCSSTAPGSPPQAEG